MASSLTKDQQLSAANAQYKNWVNQQIAANGGYYPTIDQINSYKAGILNTGLYPDLDIGVAPPSPGSDVNIAPSQFFIVGQGGNLNEDRSSGYTGQAIFSSGISDSTTLDQFTAAQDAYQSGLEQVYRTQGTELAGQAQAAQSALAAAQARVKALEAQLAADSAVDPTLTSSAQVQAASSAANQRLGQEISPQRETQLSAIDQQYNDYRSSGTVIQNIPTNTGNDTRQAQLDAINDTYIASSSGNGTDVTTQLQQIQQAQKTSPTDAVAVSNTQTVNAATRGVSEDNPQNGAVTPDTDTRVYTDQQTNGMMGRGLPNTADTNTNATNNGSNSVSILKSGKAYGEGITGGTTSSSTKTTGNASRPNKLHNYVNYTYRLSLYAIPRETVNSIFASSTTPTNQQILNNSVWICSDSGQGGNERDGNFPVDLTIDNLELETIVNANNGRTRATDVIRLKFDIIEPYTVNFLGRLMKLSANVNPNGNWSTMFFVMKIEFMGYSDSGQPIVPSNSGDTIPNTTKFIPFTMISMKFNVTSSGGKYHIDAIPVNALALTALDNQIPFHVEVSGQNINDLFNEGLESNTKTNVGQAGGGGLDRFDRPQITNVSGTVNGNNTTVTKGLAKALNANEEQKVSQNTQGKPNTYAFDFQDSLPSAKVVDPEKYFKIQGVPGVKGKNQDEIEKGNVGSLVADIDKGVFRANPGTRITDFISSVLSVSDYMTNQYKENGANSSEPLKTWKITPVVKFNDIDPKTNFYARDITYVVREFLTYGQDAPNFGQARVENNRIVKTYKYIYSGNNQDVLDAQIDFQMAFFELKNGVPMNYIDRDGLTPGAPQPQTSSQAPSTIKRFFMPRYQYTNGLANRQNTGPTTIDLKSIAVQELMEKLFDNRGDMITLDITIVGDPDWISQDYPLMHPSVVGNDAYLQNGSINFSNTVYFNFYFATPNTDYNDVTGIFDDTNNYSEFSGIYQVVSVKSNFSNGRFTQKLTNFRVRNQEEVQSTSIRKDSVNPNSPTSSNNANAPLERATNTITIPADPRLNLAAGTNAPQNNNQPTYNITDPRVGIAPPPNTWTEDTAISNYFMGTQ